MFFHAHAYQSFQRSGKRGPQRTLGALLPDSALTGVIGWSDLHDTKQINQFAEEIEHDNELDSVVEGVRDHFLLDERSH